jgi:hypothetical protein
VYGTARAYLTRRAMIVSAAILVLLVVGVSAIATASTRDSATTNWPRNASGQTYGSGLFARSLEDEPDLIRVEATNGKVGYSLRTDLEWPNPKTPEEALRIQAARAGKSRWIPVYLSDGATKIGVFECEH